MKPPPQAVCRVHGPFTIGRPELPAKCPACRKEKLMEDIGQEEAVRIAESECWKEWSNRTKVEFQLFTDRLCMPFSEFQRALEAVLGRPVWTHEMGLNWKGLQAEFLGERPAPTMDQILALIPPEKLIVIQVEDGNG